MDRGVIRLEAETRRARRRVRRAVLPLAALIGLGSLTACAPPDYRYVASDSDDIVVKVPWSWTSVRAGVPVTSDGSTPSAGSWVQMWDSSTKPSYAHASATGSTTPVAVVRTFVVTKAELPQITDDVLRDLGSPVTEAGRTAAGYTADSGPAFSLITSTATSSRTTHGIHVVYSYDLSTGTEVFDKVAVVDTKNLRVHLFLVHCLKSCYDADSSRLDAVATSLTLHST